MKRRQNARPETLYVRGLNWIGDAVISLGALQALKKVRPDILVTVGAPESTADIYRLSGSVDSIVAPALWHRGPFFKFDTALVLPRSFRSALESWPISRNRIGFASEGRSLFLTRALSYSNWRDLGKHQSTYYEALFREIDPRLVFEPPKCYFPPSKIDEARSRMGAELLVSTSLIAVNPGAYFGRAKTWPIDHFATLIGKLLKSDPDLRILLFSGKADLPLASELKRRIADERVRSFAGQLTLQESAAVLSLCDFLITNDSGMMHLGGAVGLPGVALFGPTDPVATGPIAVSEGRGLTVMRHPVSCQPCFLRECPIDHRCMEKLEPEEVFLQIALDLPECIPGRRQ